MTRLLYRGRLLANFSALTASLLRAARHLRSARPTSATPERAIVRSTRPRRPSAEIFSATTTAPMRRLGWLPFAPLAAGRLSVVAPEHNWSAAGTPRRCTSLCGDPSHHGRRREGWSPADPLLTAFASPPGTGGGAAQLVLGDQPGGNVGHDLTYSVRWPPPWRPSSGSFGIAARWMAPRGPSSA
jgi:hypothetical protein